MEEKNELIFLMLIMITLLHSNLMVVLASATSDSDPVDIMEAHLIQEITCGRAQSNKTYSITEILGCRTFAGYTCSKQEGKSDALIIKSEMSANLASDRVVNSTGSYLPTCIAASNEGLSVGRFTFSLCSDKRNLWLLKVDNSDNVQYSFMIGTTEFEVYTSLEGGEKDFRMASWKNSFSQGKNDFHFVELGFENEDSWLSAYNFLVYALVLSTAVSLVLLIVFLLIRRYVNQKISEQKE